MTLTDEYNQHIADRTDVQLTKIIRDLIDDHDTTKMDEGVRYYENKNDIIGRKQYYYKDGRKVVDTEKPNNRIPHNWHKLLVDQKTSYIVGQPIVFEADEEGFTEGITEILGEQWGDTQNELVKGASNKGVEYLHPYIDENGEFDYVIFPAEQVILVYEGSKQKRVQNGLRYYVVTVNGNDRIKAEWYDENAVTFFIENDNGEFVLDDTEEENPASHFYYNEQGYGWGKVPIIPFKNNEEEMSDLSFYKELIDAFDLSVSNVTNNVEEIQSLIYILKGYEGTDLNEFIENLRYYKAMKTDSEGGVDTLQAETPIETVNSHLDRLEDSIFTFGQGVNVTSDHFGNSPSGIALQFLYSLLDLKCNILERKFRRSLQELIWFIAEYLSVAENKQYDYRKVRYTFNRSMLVNELEHSQIAQQSMGVISHDTIVSRHPWVEDVQAELERLKQEQNEIDLNVSLGGNDEPNTED